jgi:hypothetical protein
MSSIVAISESKFFLRPDSSQKDGRGMSQRLKADHQLRAVGLTEEVL